MNIRAIGKSAARSSLMAFLVAGAAPAFGQSWPPAPLSEAKLYSFTNGADGGNPAQVKLLPDGGGALYGTTSGGGGTNNGVVFKLTPPGFGAAHWTETVLYSFSGLDGAFPFAGLARDSSGALYGVTSYGGANNLGVAFKLAPPISPSTKWTYTKIYDFNQATGGSLYNAPIIDGAGALIGTATAGGTNASGAVYKLTPPSSPGNPWSGAALYNFTGGADGGVPSSTLLADNSGAVYGTAQNGGSGGGGVVFKLTPSGANCAPASPNLWCETVLYSFSGGNDGGAPTAGLTLDSFGTFYGTAFFGGAYNKGVAFSLTPPKPPSTQWLETVLHSFAGGQDGAFPSSPLILVGGALYGVTQNGAGGDCSGLGCGAAFRLTPPAAPSMQWNENILYRFNAGVDGAFPIGGLTLSPLHFGLGSALYGVALWGGASNYGTVFSLQCAQPAREVFGGAQHAACAQ
ncbi:choice-of-anchor tandem repeat GloVer-containing protein [Methylocystis heyeri]|uniref:Uncharacterized protein n=1 Tax=Methylocystis heyeri TaxID=391905 RepID=A0A6B8KH42_9HYPH|nr:choice-of-anchor tandem repeat GloVer-containing protein [Methylocystis heyeri]QGM45760.1 hypothetical protein H2LOC_008625 [Methylocystis heyeri]